jgi:hypothetical protein
MEYSPDNVRCMLARCCWRGYVFCLGRGAISPLSQDLSVASHRKPRHAIEPPSSDLHGDPLRIPADRISRSLVELVVNFSETSPKFLLQVGGRPMAAERRKTKGLLSREQTRKRDLELHDHDER